MENTTANVFDTLDNAALLALKTQYSANESIVKMVDGILEVRKATEAKAKAAEEFKAKVAGLAKLPAPPDGIVNLWLRYAEVDIPSGKPVATPIVKVQAILGADGAIITPAVIESEMRQPTTKGMAWVIEFNKATPAGVKAPVTPIGTKRAITVKKVNGNALEVIGNFTNATKACGHLKLLIGGDSAARVLQRNGYITTPYDGTDTIA